MAKDANCAVAFLRAAVAYYAGLGVQINGPLVVASSESPAASYPFYDPFYAPYYYYPFVTTLLDRGRSRHLTSREPFGGQSTGVESIPQHVNGM